MKKNRYSPEQIIYALKQGEGGEKAVEICRKMGVSKVRELRQLREENTRLKQLAANLSLDKHMLQEVISKKL